MRFVTLSAALAAAAAILIIALKTLVPRDTGLQPEEMMFGSFVINRKLCDPVHDRIGWRARGRARTCTIRIITCVRSALSPIKDWARLLSRLAIVAGKMFVR